LAQRGRARSVTRNALLEIITKHVATKRLVNRGTAAEPLWSCEFRALMPDEKTLRTLLTAETLAQGSLIQRVPNT
jgi:hypothetical protein